MASVTFITGNGLDLSFGLKTSYRDFYSYVTANSLHPENTIYKAIRKDPETWADFEIALGRHTWLIEKLPLAKREAASIKFHEELEDVSQDLADYLEDQDKIASIALEAMSFERDGFFDGLPLGQKNKIRSLIGSGPLPLNFVTLNYTGTLQKIFPHLNVLPTPDGVYVREIHHLHGTLIENMTLGLSDETQLFDGMSIEERDDLIKPRLISSMNDGRIETFERIIDGSSIIVLFGTSLGESDRYIWERIIKWLRLNSTRHIVVHKHDSSYNDRTKRTSRGQKQFNARVQNKLLSHTSLSDNEKAMLKSRIFIIHNTKKLFAIK